jgi:molybdenum-dependent DNA-binding transcriptional regulator ModE
MKTLENKIAAPASGRGHRGRLIEIKGETFVSLKAATRHFQVPYKRAYSRLLAGMSPADAFSAPFRRRRGIPVVIGGLEFHSIKAATRHFDVPYERTLACLRAGVPLDAAFFVADPVVVGGLQFRSIKAATRHFNVPYTRTLARLRAGMSLDAAFVVVDLRKPPREQGPEQVPCAVDGVAPPRLLVIKGMAFPSVASACRHFGLPYSRVWSRLQAGMEPDEAFVCPHRTKQQVALRGQKFESIRAACAHFGIKISTYNWRRKNGYSVEDAICMPVDATRARTGQAGAASAADA